MYNKVFLIGNLTRDPELRYTPSGIAVARFTIAVNRFRRKGNQAGTRPSEDDSQEVDFIPVVAWRRLAEICGEFLKKGRPVAVEGRFQVRNFEDKSGEKRTMSEVVADNLQMLGRKPDSVGTTVSATDLPITETVETDLTETNDKAELTVGTEEEIPF